MGARRLLEGLEHDISRGARREQAGDEPEMLCLIVASLVSKSRSFLVYLYYGALTRRCPQIQCSRKSSLIPHNHPTSLDATGRQLTFFYIATECRWDEGWCMVLPWEDRGKLHFQAFGTLIRRF